MSYSWTLILSYLETDFYGMVQELKCIKEGCNTQLCNLNHVIKKKLDAFLIV